MSEQSGEKKGNGNGEAVGAALIKAKQGLTPHDVAYAFAASGYFHDVRKVSQAVVKIAAGSELGLGPMASVNGIHFIEGQLSPGANVMATLIRRSLADPRGGVSYDYKILHLDDVKCTIRFSRRFVGTKEWEHLQPDITFTIDDARRAGLVKPRSGYEKHPQNLLFARTISNGFKWHCPELAGGMPLYDRADMESVVEGEFREDVSTPFIVAGEVAAGDDIDPPFEDEEFPPAPEWEGGPTPPEDTLPRAEPARERQPNQWEDEIRRVVLDLQLVSNEYAVTAILNRSPFRVVPFGRLDKVSAVAWFCVWGEVTDELGKKAPSEQRQAVAAERWEANKAKYLDWARAQLGAPSAE